MITATEAHKISDNYLSPKMAQFIKSYNIEESIQYAARNGKYSLWIKSPKFLSEDGLKTWEREEWPTYEEVKKYFGQFGYRVERVVCNAAVPGSAFTPVPLYIATYTFRW